MQFEIRLFLLAELVRIQLWNLVEFQNLCQPYDELSMPITSEPESKSAKLRRVALEPTLSVGLMVLARLTESRSLESVARGRCNKVVRPLTSVVAAAFVRGWFN